MSKEGKVKVTKIIRADGISYRTAGGGAVSDSAEHKKSEKSTKIEQAAGLWATQNLKFVLNALSI